MVQDSSHSASRQDAMLYLGHPVNAYNMLKKWHSITEEIQSQASLDSECMDDGDTLQSCISCSFIGAGYSNSSLSVYALSEFTD